MAQYLGLDAALHPELMWLVDCALTPELPPISSPEWPGGTAKLPLAAKSKAGRKRS